MGAASVVGSGAASAGRSAARVRRSRSRAGRDAGPAPPSRSRRRRRAPRRAARRRASWRRRFPGCANPGTTSSPGAIPTIRPRCSKSAIRRPCSIAWAGASFSRGPAFAIVGSRNATPQGCADAEAFGAALSDAGFTIVSGLAIGIDAAAHRGGLTRRRQQHRGRRHRPRSRLPGAQSRPRARTRRAGSRRFRIRRRHAAAEAEFPAPQPARERLVPRRARGGGNAVVRLAHHRATRR